jgi:bacteriorhodopsin
MDPEKSGLKTSELWTTVATITGLLVAVLPVTMAYLPPDSRVYAIVAVVLAVATALFTYVKGRNDIKTSTLDALGSVNVARINAGAPTQDPPKPPSA